MSGRAPHRAVGLTRGAVQVFAYHYDPFAKVSPGRLGVWHEATRVLDRDREVLPWIWSHEVDGDHELLPMASFGPIPGHCLMPEPWDGGGP